MTEIVDRDFQEVAGVFLDFLQAHGFGDAELMPDAGSGAFDINSTRAIAEIHADAPPSRPAVQRLDGVSRAEEKPAILFSARGFTASAEEWANNVGIALFEFDKESNEIVPVNSPAEKLVAKPPSREEAILAAASRAVENTREELKEERIRQDADPEKLKRIEEAKAWKKKRRDLLS